MVEQVNNFKLFIYLVCITYRMEIWVGENKIEDTPNIQRNVVNILTTKSKYSSSFSLICPDFISKITFLKKKSLSPIWSPRGQRTIEVQISSNPKMKGSIFCNFKKLDEKQNLATATSQMTSMATLLSFIFGFIWNPLILVTSVGPQGISSKMKKIISPNFFTEFLNIRGERK